MAIEFRCQQCDTLLRTGDDKAGKRAKCPNCGTMVQTPFPDGTGGDDYDDYEVDPPDQRDAYAPPPGGAPPMRSTRMIECAMCGEEISAHSNTCEYCGEPVRRYSGGPPSGGGYQSKPTSGLAVASLVLGILGIVCVCVIYIGLPCAVLATIFGGVGLKITGTGEREGRGMAIAGLVMGIVALALYAIVFLVVAAAVQNFPRAF